MAKTTYKKKIKNGKEYYFYRLRHKNLLKPKDIYGSTVKELDKKIKDLTYELDNGIQNNKELFGTFFKDWLYNTHMIDKKLSTKERYDGIYRNYIEGSDLYTIRLKDLTPLDIQNYYNKLINDKKSVSIIKNLHKLITPCIRYAYDSNRIIKNFSAAIILPKDTIKAKKTKVTPFTLQEQIQFIEAIRGHEYEMLFLTALDTGLRQGELFALKWDDIDFDNKIIRVNKTFKNIRNISTGKYENTVQTPKTDKSIRIVPIPIHLIDKLKKHRKNQKALKLKLANLYKDNNLVFSNTYGKYLDSGNVLKKFKKIIDNINANEEDENKKIAERKFHDLRHTYATRLFELGENPKTVQELLGHSNISITLDTYTHVLDNLKEKAVSKLDNLYINMGVK